MPSTDLYEVIRTRRDVRAEFTGDPVPDDVLRRVLSAAHAAPSVGHSQPWDFVLVRAAEGLGVGWVSFYREEFLQDLLGIPSRVRPVAWLCVGAVSRVQEVPDLGRHGWRRRRPLEASVHHERYGATDAAATSRPRPS